MSFFSIGGLLIFFLLNLYSYKSLCKNRILKKYSNILLFIFMLIYSFEIAFFMRWTSTSEFAYHIAVYSIAFSFMSFCILLPSDIIARIFMRRLGGDAVHFSYDIAVILTLICYITFGVKNALYDTQITKRDIEIPGLKEDYKAVMISDIHLGDTLKQDFSKKIVSMINEQKPDFVFIVGDFIDTKMSKLGDIALPFKELKSRFGTFFVSGNHEYYQGIEPILEYLKELNITALENSSIALENINIAGINDISAPNFGYDSNASLALKNINSANPTILLAHQPKAINLMSQNDLKSTNLILSGHTHAGQVFPFSLLVWMIQKYIYGEYDINGSKLVVSSGAGFWGPPIKILSKSEIVVLNLSSQKRK